MQPGGTVPDSDKGTMARSILLLPQGEENVLVRIKQRSMARVLSRVSSAVADDA